MSGEEREERLRREVIELREELRRLTLRVDRQGDQLSDLASAASSAATSQRGSLRGFRVGSVEERSEESAFRSPSSRGGEAEIESAGYSLVTEEPPAGSGAAFYTWAFREEVARGIGLFLQRSLRRQNRGPSGRQRLSGIQSRYYIVVRDAEGVVSTHPVRVLRSFSAVKTLCQRAGQFRDAIFVGVPTIREGRVAVEAAGFDWPVGLNQ